MRETTLIVEPCRPHSTVLQQNVLGLFKVLNRHLVFAHQVRIFGKKFFGLGFKNLPRRVGDDGIEAAAPVHDLVKFIAPMKWGKPLDIGLQQGSLFDFTCHIFCRVPSGLFKHNTQALKLL